MCDLKDVDRCVGCGLDIIICECERKPVTYDSETATPEDIERLNQGFYQEDLSGGLMNVQVPEEELKRQREALEYAQSFIDMKWVGNTPCYRTDLVHMKLTPEQLVVLKEVLEAFSSNIEMTDYLYTEKQMSNLYDHQSYVRDLRDEVNDALDAYVCHRPYSPFLPSWVKRIGKNDVAKKDI